MQCISCPIKESRRFYANGQCEKCRNAAYYKANKERIKEKSALWAILNREKVRSIASKWALNNRKAKNFEESMRRAKKRRATPKWLTTEQREQIKAIYKNCPYGYEVDHVMPLRGKQSSGLHVPWNLQYLPISENRKKGNKIKEVSLE